MNGARSAEERTEIMGKSAKVCLGHGERLVLLGHEVAIAIPGDRSDVTDVYTAQDWRTCSPPTYGLVAGDFGGEYLFEHRERGLYGRQFAFRFARCRSEEKRFERLFARTFKDSLRIAR